MSREFPGRVSNVGRDLMKIAGSYLHSVTAGDWPACAVCALPIDPAYRLCYQCQQHSASGLPLADRTGFLVYADEPASQTYRMMRGYKESPTRAEFEPIIRGLLAVGLRGHFECALRLSGSQDYGWAVVPSTRGRTVLADIVRGLAVAPECEIPVTFMAPAPKRNLRPEAWSVGLRGFLPRHVVVIDDAWVSGASSQSLALAMKQAGVQEVSILSVARVLSPTWTPNTHFLRSVLPRLPYDWTVCPWTGATCP